MDNPGVAVTVVVNVDNPSNTSNYYQFRSDCQPQICQFSCQTSRGFCDGVCKTQIAGASGASGFGAMQDLPDQGINSGLEEFWKQILVSGDQYWVDFDDSIEFGKRKTRSMQ